MKTQAEKQRKKDLERANFMLLQAVHWLKDLGLSDIQVMTRLVFTLQGLVFTLQEVEKQRGKQNDKTKN